MMMLVCIGSYIKIRSKIRHGAIVQKITFNVYAKF